MSDNREVKISVKGLKKSFGKLQVLKGIDTEIKAGEVICVIGPSGSGKSTFLRCLNRLEEATGGEILVDGESITDKKADINKIRRHIGMVFQQFNLFPHYTAKENVMLAPVELKLKSKRKRKRRPCSCLSGSAFQIKRMLSPNSCQAASSRESPLPGPWPWSRISCFLMSPHRLWTRRWSARFWM